MARQQALALVLLLNGAAVCSAWAQPWHRSVMEVQAQAVACSPGPAAAVLDMNQVIQRALCNNPRTQQSWSDQQASAALLQQERAKRWPTANASLGSAATRQRLREDGETSLNKASTGNAALELSWVLLDFGQQGATTQVAHQSLLAAAAAHDDRVAEVAMEAALAYLSVAEAELTLQLLIEEARFTDNMMEKNAQRLDAKSRASEEQRKAAARQPASRSGRSAGAAAAGLNDPKRAPPASAADTEKALDDELERLQLQADQSRASLERRLVRGNLLQARAALASQLSLPPGHELRVDPNALGSGLDFNPDDLDGLMEEVLRDHPALRAARARLGAADASVDAARRSELPRLLLNNSLRRERNVLRNYSQDSAIGLQLDIPLFAGFARKHREAQALAERSGAAAELRNIEQQMALQTWSSYQSFQTYNVALRQAMQFEKHAKALLAGELRSYAAGNSDLHDVLDAQSTVVEASLSRVSTLTELQRARVRLAAAVGQLHRTAFGGPAPARP